MPAGGTGVGASAASHGLKSTEGLPTMSSSLVPGRDVGSRLSSEPPQYVNPGSNVSVAGQLMSKEPSHFTNPVRVAPGQTQTVHPVQPASAQAIHGLSPAASSHGLKSSEELPAMSSNFPQMPAGRTGVGASAASHGLKSTEGLPTMSSSLVPGRDVGSRPFSEPPQYVNPGSNVSVAGQLMSKEPSHFTNPVRVAPGQSQTVHPVQPASAQAIGGLSPAASSQGLRSTEHLPPMPSNVPQDQNSPHAMSYRNVEASGGVKIESQRVGPTPQNSSQRQSHLGPGDESKHTLEHQVQPSSTVTQPGNLDDKLGNMTLSDVEGLLRGADQPLKLYRETVIDAAKGEVELGSDVVKDSATPKRPTSQEPTSSTPEQDINLPILNFTPPTESKTETKLREYQVELAELGKQGYNYIICAPTGSGKTITAAHVCYERMLATERERKVFKALFIVPTRHLKKQQRDAFNDLFVPGQVTSLGEGQQLNDVFSKGNIRVLMITAQILVNVLKQQQFKLTSASMIIFDECHHTTLNHPYNEIMRQYLKEKKTLAGNSDEQWPVGRPYRELPQVVGESMWTYIRSF